MTSDKMLLNIPSDLICDPRLPPLAKAVYMTLVQVGPCSLLELSAASQVNRETLRDLVRLLGSTGWARIEGRSNRRLIVPIQPEEIQRRLIDHLKQVRSVGFPVGENLSRLVLNVEVADDHYIDNARPHFLQNRKTGEYLELDRWYYERRVGEEYQGIQHFEVTDMTDEEKLKEIQARDAMKVEFCRTEGIPLMIITEDDLSLDGILAKLPPELPRAHLDRKSAYVRTLDELCQAYVANCKRARLRDARARERRK